MYKILLDYYMPKRWSPRLVGHDLTNLTRDLGFVPSQDPAIGWDNFKAPWHSRKLCAYVRRRTVKNPRATDWHQDGDLIDDVVLDDYLVLWSSNTPTELRDFGGVVHTPPRRAVILVDNTACYHRRPPEAPHVRWLFRQRVYV